MATTDGPAFLDDYLPYLLQRAGQLLSTRFLRYLTEQGLQGSEWRILVVLADSGPLSVGQLTRLTLLPQPTATHAVGRLERRGDVKRRLDASDGRIRIVALTARGRRCAEKLKAAAGENLQLTLREAGLEIPAALPGDLIRIAGAIDASLPRPTRTSPAGSASPGSDAG